MSDRLSQAVKENHLFDKLNPLCKRYLCLTSEEKDIQNDKGVLKKEILQLMDKERYNTGKYNISVLTSQRRIIDEDKLEEKLRELLPNDWKVVMDYCIEISISEKYIRISEVKKDSISVVG